ncbi:MAG: hypothetical protein M3R02_30640 [Chloroflexota bacterium]|nr:hypothetical protein [Chloroflexota bacterium]
MIHRRDGQPISLCRHHARIYEGLFTPITRWQPKAEDHPDRGPSPE